MTGRPSVPNPVILLTFPYNTCVYTNVGMRAHTHAHFPIQALAPMHKSTKTLVNTANTRITKAIIRDVL